MVRRSSEKSKAKATSTPSDVVDVGLEVAATVLRTLQAVAGASPIPGLAQAANLAVQITTTVQKVRGNKDGFDQLATDSRELVYVIFRANQDVEKEEDLPTGLREGLDQVLDVLHGIKAIAEKGASRNRFWAFIRAGVDAGQIQDYRQKLQQCLGTFGFQSDINLQVEVHKLVAQQGKVLELLENKDKADAGGESRGPGSSGSPGSPGDSQASPWGRGMKINGTGGNVEMNHVSNVTNNTDSGNNFTNSTVNKNNSSTVNNNINRSGDTVTNDYSVKMGEGVNFSGASGVNFWSNNGNNTGRSSM